MYVIFWGQTQKKFVPKYKYKSFSLLSPFLEEMEDRGASGMEIIKRKTVVIDAVLYLFI